MSVVTLNQIEKTFGRRVLFDRLNFNVEQGERIGLIGSNGSGKTTLFRLVTGAVTPDAGVAATSKGVRIGYLTQDPQFDPANSVMDQAELAFAELHALAHRMRDQEHAMATAAGEELERILHQYQQTQHEFDLAGGYAWQHRLEATLLGVGLGRETWEQNVQTLSGGQRSRLSLAGILIGEPDLLLLDEPTNHLDLAAIEWLEKYLASFAGAVVVISHDRYLLDRLATRIVHLTECRLKSYPGNYSAFVQQRDMQELTQRRAYEEQQADIEKQKEFIRRFGAGQRSREAKGREKRLNRLLESDRMVRQVETGKKIRLSLGTDQRAGDRVLIAEGLTKSFDSRKLWSDLKFEIRRGERIGIIGPNGSGKTTLLATLLGRTDADAGEIRWGANLNIGYYDQRLDEFDPALTVMETAWEDRDVNEQQVRDVLAMMLFRGEDADKTVGLLSGGERARLRLCQLLLDRPNVLVLDEPTNHLDIPSCEALEGALADFEGTILCVSHDRYFLEKTAQRLFVLDPPGMTDFEGRYSEWAARAASEPGAKTPPSPVKTKQPAKSGDSAERRRAIAARKDNPYLRPFGRLTLAELERKICDTETELAERMQAMGEGGRSENPSRRRQMEGEYKTLSRTLEELEAEYFARGENESADSNN